MKKATAVAIIFFLAGIVVSFFLDSILRNLVISLYKWTTNNHIQFIGKNIYFFATPFYYLSFGFTFLILALHFLNRTLQQNILSVILCLSILTLAIITMCALHANYLLLECTACDEGIRFISYKKINNSIILGSCAILSTLPSLISLKQKK